METKLLRLPDVRQIVGLSRSEIYRRMAAGTFPRSVPIGDSARAWVAAEVSGWCQERIAARDAEKIGKPLDSGKPTEQDASDNLNPRKRDGA